MDHLFAPWRLEYIAGKRPEGCIFCRLPLESGRERDNLILLTARFSFVMMNRFPYNSGHLLVAPLRHTSDLTGLTSEENLEISQLLQQSVAILKTVWHPEGFNLGLNLGQAGGAGIRDHLHWHVVPRWNGDTNFTTVLADIRSVPQHLLESWDALRPHFASLPSQRAALPEDGAGGSHAAAERRASP